LRVGLTQPVFRVDTQPIGETIDVIEIGHHLTGIMDFSIIPSSRAEAVRVGPRHVLWSFRELVSPGAKRFFGVGERCILPAMCDKMVG